MLLDLSSRCARSVRPSRPPACTVQSIRAHGPTLRTGPPARIFALRQPARAMVSPKGCALGLLLALAAAAVAPAKAGE